MVKLLSICGSPVDGSSTEVLLRRIARSVSESLEERSRHTFIRLNDFDIAPCQACGEAPTPRYCFLDDDMTAIYRKLVQCDCLLFGSPIYFDSVSAQAKVFVDRCNCMRPADFDNTVPNRSFVSLLSRKRPGAIVLVGGEQGWFEGARRCIAGFFKWIEVTNVAALEFSATGFTDAGEAADCAKVLTAIEEIGRKLAEAVRKQRVRR